MLGSGHERPQGGGIYYDKKSFANMHTVLQLQLHSIYLKNKAQLQFSIVVTQITPLFISFNPFLQRHTSVLATLVRLPLS